MLIFSESGQIKNDKFLNSGDNSKQVEFEKSKTILEEDYSAEDKTSIKNIANPCNLSNSINFQSNMVSENDHLKRKFSKDYLLIPEENNYIEEENEINESGNVDKNYLGQVFEGAKVNFDVNRENIENKITNIIKKKKKEDKIRKNLKQHNWKKIRGLLNFFLIMRSELFRRKIKGLNYLHCRMKDGVFT